VFAEPVLVCLAGPFRPLEVYDQRGAMLAFATQRGDSRLERLLRSGPRSDIFDIHGQLELRLDTDRTWAPRLFRATSPDGDEIGRVIAAGDGRGSILADGVRVGDLRVPTGVWGQFGIGGRRGRYTLRDANDSEVGRITSRMFVGRPTCNVIEVEQQASGTLRALVLSASLAVSYWLQRSGG
jgi:hypothetical protein